MGIQHLNRYLKEKCNTGTCNTGAIKHISFNDLRGKRIAVDISIYMYKFSAEGALIDNMYQMIGLFKLNGIIPFFVFDGKPPQQKYELLKIRKQEKIVAEEKFKQFEATPLNEREVEKFINPFKPYWQNRYYRALFDIKTDTTGQQRRDVVINYLEGLEWTMKYYTSGCPDWRWRYKYNYPPLLQDLIKHVPVFSTEFVIQKPKNPVTEIVQLCYVLPRNSLALLPKILHEQLLEKHSDWYKNDCEFVWAYCRYFWESHVNMNEIDINELEQFILANKKTFI